MNLLPPHTNGKIGNYSFDAAKLYPHHISADPGLGQGRGGAWDHRRCGTSPSSLSKVKPISQPASCPKATSRKHSPGMLHPPVKTSRHLDMKIYMLWASTFSSGRFCLSSLKQPFPHSPSRPFQPLMGVQACCCQPLNTIA